MQVTAYPGLKVAPGAEIMRFLLAMLNAPVLSKIAFVTEGGQQMAPCAPTLPRLVDRPR